MVSLPRGSVKDRSDQRTDATNRRDPARSNSLTGDQQSMCEDLLGSGADDHVVWRMNVPRRSEVERRGCGEVHVFHLIAVPVGSLH